MAPTDLELVYPNGQRKRIKLPAKPLNQGADGAIFAIPRNKLALKLYHNPNKDPERPEKIRQMLLAPPDDSGSQYFAWPVARIVTRQGRFVGYAMPLLPVSSYTSLDLLLTRKGRQMGNLPESRNFRIRAASNLAKRVAQLHAKGHCIIDMKPANLLVHRTTADIVVVDCDGFGIQGENEFIPGHQFTTGYIAPDAWNARAKPEALDKKQDLFALAVIIFQLLNEGLHPYQGIPADKQDIPGDTQNRIGEGLYPYGVRPNARIKPSPWSLHRDFPHKLTQAFDHAFGNGSKRLHAGGWGDLLDQAYDELKTCKKNREHVFWGVGCPLCEQSSVTIEVKKTKARTRARINPQPGIHPYQNPLILSQPRSSSSSGTSLFKSIGVVFVILMSALFLYNLYQDEKHSQYYAEQMQKSAERERQRLKAIKADKIRNGWQDVGQPATATTVHNSLYALPAASLTGNVSKAEYERQVPYFQPGAFSSNNAIPLLNYSPVQIAWEHTGERPVSRVNLNLFTSELTEVGRSYALKNSGSYQLRDWYVHPKSESLYIRKCGFQMNCYQLARITPDGKETAFEIEHEPKNDGSGHRHQVSSWYFAVTEDERYIVVARRDRLLIYRPEDPKRAIAEIEYPLSYSSHRVVDLAMTPNGEQIYVGLVLSYLDGAKYRGTVLELTMNNNGQAELTHDFTVDWPSDGSKNSGTVDVSNDGETLAVGSYQELKIDESTYTRYGKPVKVSTAKPGITVWKKKGENNQWRNTGKYVLDRQGLLKAPSRPGMLSINMYKHSLPGNYRFNIGFDLTADGSRLLSGMETQKTRQGGHIARAWVLDIYDGVPKLQSRLQRGYEKTKAYPVTAISTNGKNAVIGWAHFQKQNEFSSIRKKEQLHLSLTAFDLGERLP